METVKQQEASDKTLAASRTTMAPASLSVRLDIWKAFNDKYLRYVTMWFTAATLSVVILSFCIKSVIVDQTFFVTRLIVGIVAGIISLAACVLSCVVRPRAYRFAEQITAIETLLSMEEGLNAYFQPLPRRPMMKLLVDVSILMSGIISFLIWCILILLVVSPDTFSSLTTKV